MVKALGGQVLEGRYQLGELLGRGGMAVVYDGIDLRLARPIAVKVLQGIESASGAERLYREARAAARANHPGVITVFAQGTDVDLGVDYVVMERLFGQDLAACIEQRAPLPIDLVLRLAVEVSDALAAVHAIGVVHRDLKPSNVFLARAGATGDRIKLLDFGVAKHFDLSTLTESGELVGTIAYMAPEQLSEPDRVEARSDLFALGVLLYECLLGRRPFAGGDLPALTAAILYGEPAPLAQLRPDVPRELARIVEHCLQRRLIDRPRSARDVCDALQRISA